MIKFVSVKVKTAITSAEIKYGHIIRLKLIPLLRMAIISVLTAIFDVKNITAINTNNGAKRVAKYGMKFR
jgi:hypothetical protein